MKQSNLYSLYGGFCTAWGRMFLIAYISQNLYDQYYKEYLNDELWHECTYYHDRNIAFNPQEPWAKTGEALVDNVLPMPTLFDPRLMRIPSATVTF